MKRFLRTLSCLALATLGSTAMNAQTVVSSVDGLSNDKAYVLSLKNRGTLAYTANGICPTEQNAKDPNQQVAIYQSNGKYYLYSVGGNCFYTVGNAQNAYSPYARTSYTITMDEVTMSGYPFVFDCTDGTNHLNVGKNNNIAIDDWGTHDEGNCFKIEEAGELSSDTKAKIATAIKFKELPAQTNAITELSELSNNKSYYIFSKRGLWAYDPDNSTRRLTATPLLTNPYLDNANKEFALLKKGDNYYVYNVAAKRFVGKGGQGTRLTTKPEAINSILASTGSTDYPWVVAVGESHIGISTSYTAQGGLITFYNDLADEGNRVGFAVAGNFDPTEALAQIEAAESFTDNMPELTNSAATANDIDAYKTYYVFTADRGLLSYDPSYSTTALTSTMVGDKFMNNANKEFAIIKGNKGYYLYSVAAKKYVSADGKGTVLTDTPNQAAELLQGKVNQAEGADDTTHPYVFQFNGKQLNISNGDLAQGGVISSWNDVTDPGNKFGFMEVNDFNPSEVIKQIKEVEEIVLVSATPEADSQNSYKAFPSEIVLTLSKEVESINNDNVIRIVMRAGRVPNDVTVSAAVSKTDKKQVILTVANANLLEEGTYSVEIPESTFLSADNAYTNSALSLGYDVQPAVANTFEYASVSPKNNSTVTTLDAITLTYAAWPGGVDPSKSIVVKDAKGIEVTTATIDLDGKNYNNVIITLTDAITKTGVYTITVPEGTIFDDQFNDGDDDFGVANGATYNPEFTLVYSIGISTGINNASVLSAKANIYTIDGKKVSTFNKAAKGVYIVNGKKLIK